MKKLNNPILRVLGDRAKESNNNKLLKQLKRDGVITNVRYRNGKKVVLNE